MVSISLSKYKFRYLALFSSFLAIFLLSACGAQSDNRAGYNDPHKIVDLFIDKVSDDGLTHGVVGSACKYKYILLSLYNTSEPIHGHSKFRKYSDNRIFVIFYTNSVNRFSMVYLGINIDSTFYGGRQKNADLIRIAEDQFLGIDSGMQEDSLKAERFIVLFIHDKEERIINDDILYKLIKEVTKYFNYKVTECGSGEYGEFD